MGQSNMAAGATIGSNHNSRGADGEIIAGRGFWPGLCVSLKHNSKFASFALISKGNYMSELRVPFPFSLIVNDEHENTLKIMPGYFFMHNMYALARNSWKYVDRDKRIDKTQPIEYDYLAPDSVEEILESLELMEIAVGKAYYRKQEKNIDKLSKSTIRQTGKNLLLEENAKVSRMEILGENIENSQRKVLLLKVHKSYPLFRELITLHAIRNLIKNAAAFNITSFSALQAWCRNVKRGAWFNAGGQLMKAETLEDLKNRIRKGKIGSWPQLHEAYREIGASYEQDKLQHALACLPAAT